MGRFHWGNSAARAAIVIGLICTGCGKDPLSEETHIAGWANASSALGVFIYGYEPLAIADGELIPADDSCPSIDDDGTTLSIVGEACEDSDGTTWHGAATIVRGATGGRSVTLEGYDKSEDPDFVAPVSGTFEIAELDTDLHSFVVNVTQGGGIETSTVYEGTVEGGYDGPTLWNGSGTISRDGAIINSGTVEASTEDLLRDGDICGNQGASGTTTMVSEEHSVVITYDGATDCDDDHTAQWSRDGQDQGAITGVSCSATGHATGGAVGTIGLVVAAIILAARRRRAASR